MVDSFGDEAAGFDFFVLFTDVEARVAGDTGVGEVVYCFWRGELGKDGLGINP